MELQHDGPMLVEQLEHGDDEDGVPQQSVREESGSGSGRVDGEDERGTRAGMRENRGLAMMNLALLNLWLTARDYACPCPAGYT